MSKEKFVPVKELMAILDDANYNYIYEINMVLDSEGKTADDLLEPRDIYRFRGQDEILDSMNHRINGLIENEAIEIEREEK